MTCLIPSPRRSGSALIAVFWMIGVLGLVVYAGAKALEADAAQARQMRGRIYAKRMALMGLEIGRHPSLPPYDPLLRYTSPDGGAYEVKIVAEEARLNLNVLLQNDDRLLLPRLFQSWGLFKEEGEALLEALKDWVDSDDKAGLKGAERREYERMGWQGMPFNRPFKDLEEVRLVRGMENLEALRPDWREWFTLFGDGRVEINDARPELVALLANVPIERVAPLLALRAGRDGLRDTEDDGRLISAVQVAQLLGVYQPQIVDQLTMWLRFDGPVRRIESTGRFADVGRRWVLITQNEQPLWRGEIPLHVPHP